MVLTIKFEVDEKLSLYSVLFTGPSSQQLLLVRNTRLLRSDVTDIGPKDSNFPQNAWGLLDSTAQDHIFSVIPGNSDHIFSVIPGNSDAIKVEQFSCQLSKYLTFVFVVLPPAYLASNRAVLRRQIQKLIFLPWNLVTVGCKVFLIS